MEIKKIESIIFGTLLGDSAIAANGKDFVCRQISKDLILYKKEIITKFLPNSKISYIEHPSYFDGQWNHKPIYELRAKHQFFRDIRSLFYDSSNKRIIDPYVLDRLNYSGIALWYADDGTTAFIGQKRQKFSRRVEICTDRYSVNDIDKLVNYFDSFLEQKPTKIKRNYKDSIANSYRLRIHLTDAQFLFAKLYRNFLKHYPSLLYKMDLGYRNDTLNNPKFVNPEYKEAFLKISAHQEFKDRLNSNDIV